MKCEHCGIEMDNPAIFHIHQNRCLEEQKLNGLISENEDGKYDVNYNDMTVEQLKNICKEKGLDGYSNLNKDDLIAFMNENIKG
ncbi:Rho termination factor N-terminal domain-containing protein [uncultured Clostridium sp.]|uniref:SAP domain-containing protein n=1 Tax=uncultured Clostridium sp. TaxID=59620 RepID=UPI0028EB92EF|nr:Rho termination factor N-terminal domain-containing protein [uncultured Clostridium sp.]